MAKKASPVVTKTAGAKFDPDDRPILFLASSAAHAALVQDRHKYILIAVNELSSGDELGTILDGDQHVLLDSGVYNLAVTYARKRGISMDEALSTPPDQVDGWPKLFDKYVRLATEYGPRCWGYIELDFGGRENKIITRAKLEALGLNPIPVYHPLNDGWDYFDYLAARYDRICVGNLVHANDDTRSRILTTIAIRRRAYPNLRWVHALGVGLTQRILSTNLDSADASSWSSSLWWGRNGLQEFACLTTFGHMPPEYTYIRGADSEDPGGYNHAVRFLASLYVAHQANTNHYTQALGVGGAHVHDR